MTPYDADVLKHDLVNGWTLKLDELLNNVSDLTIKLALANGEIANLKLEAIKNEDGRIELVAKLEDAQNEEGRLRMVVKHQIDNRELIKHLK